MKKRVLSIVGVVLIAFLSGCANIDKRELTAPCASTAKDCGQAIPINQA